MDTITGIIRHTSNSAMAARATAFYVGSLIEMRT